MEVVENGRHVKRGDPAKIAREAELLGAARHAGIVELVGIEGDPRDPLLVTRLVEGRALSDVADLSRTEIAAVVAVSASVLADLHKLGLVHGAVAPEHIILGPGGQPVLCGFGYGGRVGATSPARPQLADVFLDPAGADDGSPLDPSVDVYGLGAVLRSLIERSGLAGSDHLLEIAGDATGLDIASRPTASELAASIRSAVPGACLTGSPPEGDLDLDPDRPEASSTADLSSNSPTGAGADPSRRILPSARTGSLEALRRRSLARGQRLPRRRRGYGRRSHPVALVAVGTVALIVVVLVAPSLTRSGGAPSAPAVRPTLPTGLTTLATTVQPPGTAATVATGLTDPTAPQPDPTLVSRPECPPAAGQLLADIDGDGCAESLRYDEGILASGASRWSVGAVGDVVATGDWICRGAPVLAVLQRATGDIFVFDGWAPADHDLVATAVARVEGGFALRAAELGDGGCPRLVVDRRDGGPVAIPIGAGE